jgi:beta-lactamase superfamily II metal-dependent hydrolase
MIRTSIAALVLLLVLPWLAYGQAGDKPPFMVAHIVDVGQGDATLLQFPCGAILIDAGGDDEHREALSKYLTAFFRLHPSLDNTLESIIITHHHIDHTLSLPDVVLYSGIKVKRLIDNGQRATGSGVEQVRYVLGRIPVVRGITDAMIPAGGLTDPDIDPIRCKNIDPVITILSGGYPDFEKPGWRRETLENLNNQSLVIRVDFGKSSFLFTGDLEHSQDESQSAVSALVARYAGTALLDADVYHVGHHGSGNGTTKALVDAITPKIAVISMGRWDYGIDMVYEENHFYTWWYGHPRKAAVVLLSQSIPGERNPPVIETVFDGVAEPETISIAKSIYATGWDGTVRIRATPEGTYTVSSGR